MDFDSCSAKRRPTNSSSEAWPQSSSGSAHHATQSGPESGMWRFP